MRFTVRHISFLKLMVTALMPIMFGACVEEQFGGDSDNPGTGPVSPKITIEFEPQVAALTKATPGDAIKEVSSLSIIIYNADADTSLFAVYNYGTGEYYSENIDRDKNDVATLPLNFDGDSKDNLAESQTRRLSLTLPQIPQGDYYMYAVANMGALTDTQVSTPEKLRKINLSWKRNNIPANCQMFGYFAPGDNSESTGFKAPKISINAKSTHFHAWVKRAASKVTIVYDGSGLHEDIFVYIHKVTIHDIPKNCYLGKVNTPTSANDLYVDGETIYYNSANQSLATDPAPAQANYQQWMRVAKGSGLKGAVESDGTLHSETATALYFYENAQGNYQKEIDAGNKTHWKPQIWENVGTNVKPGMDDYKDNILNGTYIEVEGYYVSKHAPGISQGAIKYRFMLGQDIVADYNAFRNRHYKLTLKFKGYANQADWHIEYVEEIPEIYTPDEFYVSYLYNKQHMFPMRVIGDCTDLEVEIIRNDWHPYDPKSSDEVPAATYVNSDEIFSWNREVWENKGYTTTAELAATTASGNNRYYGRHKYTYTYNGATDTVVTCTPPHAGFLSLTVPTGYQNTSTELPKLLFSTNGTHWYSPRATNTMLADRGGKSIQALKDYYYNTGNKGDATAKNNIAQNKRVLIGTGSNDRSGRNKVTKTTVSDGSQLIEFPLWTRPFSMIYISGFSGNNPYEAYQRKALLRIRGKFKTQDGSIKTIKKTVPVYQVRRIINPKGVWRSANDNTPFHVQLMQRRDATSSTFEPFRSEGPWRATITTTNGSSFCYLSGAKMDGASVVGETDDFIDFTINFNGTTGATQSNCAIITVMYHSLSCEHTIFVRQGYNEPLEIVAGKGAWSSYSLYAANGDFGLADGGTKNAVGIHTVSPLALGSFFKRGNFNQAMITSNNTTYGKLVPPYNGNFALRTAKTNGSGVTSSNSTWANITGMPYTTAGGSTTPGTSNPRYKWANIEIGNRIYSLPTMEQYIALQENADVGFGVLYGDGATGVATDFTTAFGFIDPNNNKTSGPEGIRGVVVYNRNNANQVFFPVGSTGVGRRTIQNAVDDTEIGILRYGSQSDVLSVDAGVWNEHRPISYNLPNNAGAIYWAKDSDDNHNLAWDINFADLNFSPYDYGCAWGRYGKLEQGDAAKTSKGDALPIKLVFVKNK